MTREIVFTVPAMASVALLALLAGCEEPGEGAKAEQGYRQGARIVAAIEAWRRDTGAPPKSLESLAPRYVSRDDLVLAPTGATAYPFSYHVKADGSWELEFHYTGPGSNYCTWGSTTAHWQCTGAW
jgi:hypothetical protein